LYHHPDYDNRQQHQPQRGETADLSEDDRGGSEQATTHAAYTTADLAFRRRSSTASVPLSDDTETSMLYEVDDDATERLVAATKLKPDQHVHPEANRFRRSTSKTFVINENL